MFTDRELTCVISPHYGRRSRAVVAAALSLLNTERITVSYSLRAPRTKPSAATRANMRRAARRRWRRARKAKKLKNST